MEIYERNFGTAEEVLGNMRHRFEKEAPGRVDVCYEFGQRNGSRLIRYSKDIFEEWKSDGMPYGAKISESDYNYDTTISPETFATTFNVPLESVKRGFMNGEIRGAFKVARGVYGILDEELAFGIKLGSMSSRYASTSNPLLRSINPRWLKTMSIEDFTEFLGCSIHEVIEFFRNSSIRISRTGRVNFDDFLCHVYPERKNRK